MRRRLREQAAEPEEADDGGVAATISALRIDVPPRPSAFSPPSSRSPSRSPPRSPSPPPSPLAMPLESPLVAGVRPQFTPRTSAGRA